MKRQFLYGLSLLWGDNVQKWDTLFLFTGAFVSLVVIGFCA